MSNLNKLGFIALALSAVSGCGGGGGSNEPGEVVTQPPPVTSVVQSVGQAGGTVSLPGQIQLLIPQNALTADTDIVLTRIAGELGAYDALYEFAPDGLEFNHPVEIRLTYDRALLPPEVAEANLFVADLTENMQPLRDSVVDTASQTIIASTRHFSNYGPGNYAPTGVFVSQFDSRIATEWRMPIGDRNGNDMGADLSLLDIDEFPISGYPRIRFNEFGDPNDWYVATAHNQNSWLNNGADNEPSPGPVSAYSDSGAFHPGEDWNTVGPTSDDDLGLPVRAVGRGIVLYSNTSFELTGFGNIVIIGHRLGSGEFVASVYAHLQNAPTLTAGALVDQGDLVGFIGQTGFAAGSPHLHFEIARESALSIDQTGEIRIPVSPRGHWFWAGGDTDFIADNYYEPSSFIASVGNPADSRFAGRWIGVATAGTSAYDYQWDLDQNGTDVTGTIRIADPNGPNMALYRMRGTINGDSMTFEGTSFIEYSNSSTFCMASGSVTLGGAADNIELTGVWGPLAIPGGCPVGSSGGIQLRKVL